MCIRDSIKVNCNNTIKLCIIETLFTDLIFLCFTVPHCKYTPAFKITSKFIISVQGIHGISFNNTIIQMSLVSKETVFQSKLWYHILGGENNYKL